eukprot:218281-Chlamydomonas_euryale.AAC.2
MGIRRFGINYTAIQAVRAPGASGALLFVLRRLCCPCWLSACCAGVLSLSMLLMLCCGYCQC